MGAKPLRSQAKPPGWLGAKLDAAHHCVHLPRRPSPHPVVALPMGQGASTEYGPETEAFVALYQRLPPEAVAKVGALVAKEDMSLLGQHPAAPNPSPPVPVGVTVQIRSNTARAAYTLVPRLQQKQYEMVPKRCTEVQFWKAFFTHLTASMSALAAPCPFASSQAAPAPCSSPTLPLAQSLTRRCPASATRCPSPAGRAATRRRKWMPSRRAGPS